MVEFLDSWKLDESKIPMSCLQVYSSSLTEKLIILEIIKTK